ncbi:MAG: YbdK family carboxylate-amine ligase [Isosphaeraceae bacterium]|nr:YbdK family carboxylate-amine ligase [Isosphaeraceae bacterium]
MSDDRFTRNSWPTLGIEIELQLVDARTMGLRSAIGELLAGLPAASRESVKPEFMQCYVEINSEVCRTVTHAEEDLTPKLLAVQAAADGLGLRLFWSGTHPFSRWQDQRITPNARYIRLADQLRETVVRPVTFGLHVHVGVRSGDHAIQVGNLLQPHLPLLLALSANSPFWEGRSTGHQAHRIEILEGFPTGGLPPVLGGWDDYLSLVRQMMSAGFIDSPKELWWDVRPSPASGTIEVRVCDMPLDLPAVLGLTALIQCLVHELSAQFESGKQGPSFHPLMIRQNRWRACRDGLGADLVDPLTLQPRPARLLAEELATRLANVAEELGCTRHLKHIFAMVSGGTGADRQSAVYEGTGSLVEVVRRSVRHSEIGATPIPPLERLVQELPPGNGATDSVVRPGALLS